MFPLSCFNTVVSITALVGCVDHSWGLKRTLRREKTPMAESLNPQPLPCDVRTEDVTKPFLHSPEPFRMTLETDNFLCTSSSPLSQEGLSGKLRIWPMQRRRPLQSITGSSRTLCMLKWRKAVHHSFLVDTVSPFKPMSVTCSRGKQLRESLGLYRTWLVVWDGGGRPKRKAFPLDCRAPWQRNFANDH